MVGGPGLESQLVVEISVGVATDRDASRYRLLIVDAARRILYDEITAAYPRVVVARGAASDAVFVAEGTRLRRLTAIPAGA